MRDADARSMDAAADSTGATMIYVGRRLGLFKAMADAGPLTADELAEKTGLHPRWLLEWLRLQAAAKILVYQPTDRFVLPPEATDLLANEASRAYAADSFAGGYPPEAIAGLIESFRTGIGKTYESDGPEAVTKSEARHIKTARTQVLPVMIPALDGVQEKLERGALVADLGCGDGALAVALAQAFPHSTIHAMDPNSHAIAHVERLGKQHSLDNLSTFVASADSLPGRDRYDLVITFDCVHDMTDPQKAIDEIFRRLKDDGVWFVKDIRSKPKFEDNLRNPMLAMMYSFSLFTCMSSAMSEPGGAGLGTLGFNPEVAETMSRRAGFTRFRMLDFKDPGNLYYEVRP
jgi:SAM-dependent methyltransferase